MSFIGTIIVMDPLGERPLGVYDNSIRDKSVFEPLRERAVVLNSVQHVLRLIRKANSARVESERQAEKELEELRKGLNAVMAEAFAVIEDLTDSAKTRGEMKDRIFHALWGVPKNTQPAEGAAP